MSVVVTVENGQTATVGFVAIPNMYDVSVSSGTPGARGDQGFTGSAGEMGFTGSTGEPGFVGSQGIDGFTGSVGLEGPIGFTGSIGEVGFTGSVGEIGFTGSNGEVGFTGSSGEIGFTGSTGSQGPVGFTGSASVVGVVEISGANGVVDHDCSLGTVFVHTNVANSFTVNLTSLTAGNNVATDVTLILDQGTTGYMVDGVSIENAPQQLLWLGGVPPIPTPLTKDRIELGVVSTSNGFVILASGSSFS